MPDGGWTVSNYHTDPRDESIARILRSAGVETRKAVTLVPHDSVEVFGTSWDGGSRSVYTAVGENGATVNLRGPEPFGPRRDEKAPVVGLLPIGDPRALPAYIVESGTFCGKPAAVRIHAHPTRIAPLIPERLELPEAQRRVLVLVAHYNPRGRKEWRDRHAVTREAWDAVVGELVGKGLLRKGGAITPAGRNAVEGDTSDPYRFDGLEGVAS